MIKYDPITWVQYEKYTFEHVLAMLLCFYLQGDPKLQKLNFKVLDSMFTCLINRNTIDTKHKNFETQNYGSSSQLYYVLSSELKSNMWECMRERWKRNSFKVIWSQLDLNYSGTHSFRCLTFISNFFVFPIFWHHKSWCTSNWWS